MAHGRRTSSTSNLKTNPMPPNLWIPRSASSINVPAGVMATVEAPPTAIAHVHTAQGDFMFALRDLDYGHALSFRDGDVEVERTPTPQQISPEPQGATPEEHDYPSMCVTRKGVVWIAWQAYQNLGDKVYVRYRLRRAGHSRCA